MSFWVMVVMVVALAAVIVAWACERRSLMRKIEWLELERVRLWREWQQARLWREYAMEKTRAELFGEQWEEETPVISEMAVEAGLTGPHAAGTKTELEGLVGDLPPTARPNLIGAVVREEMRDETERAKMAERLLQSLRERKPVVVADAGQGAKAAEDDAQRDEAVRAGLKQGNNGQGDDQ